MSGAGASGPRPPKVRAPGPPPVVDVDRSAAEWVALAAAARGPHLEVEDEGRMLATFLLVEPSADAVLLFVNRVTDETDLDTMLMRRAVGTDVWHLTLRLGTAWRGSYCFVVTPPGERPAWSGIDQVGLRAVLDAGRADATNPDTTRNRAGAVQSVAAGPDAPDDRHLLGGAPAGSLDEVVLPSGRRAWIHRAVGSGAGSPLVVAFDGDVWTDQQDLPATIDHLVVDRWVRPPVTVLLDSGGVRQRWADHEPEGRLRDEVVDVVVPWARDHLVVSQAPTDVVVVGQSLGGLEALRVALSAPEVVGVAVSQSASLWRPDLDGLVPPAGPSPRLWLEVGLREWALTGPHAVWAQRLRDQGVDLRDERFDGGHDYACWRVGLAPALAWALGPPRKSGG